MAFIATLMAKYGQSKEQHACWAKSQMQYILGTSDKNDESFLIGYGGKQAATRPHHRGAACAREYATPIVHENNGTCSRGEGRKNGGWFWMGGDGRGGGWLVFGCYASH